MQLSHSLSKGYARDRAGQLCECESMPWDFKCNMNAVACLMFEATSFGGSNEFVAFFMSIPDNTASMH